MSMKRSVPSVQSGLFLGLVACTCWFVGCSGGGVEPPTGSVSGKVTYNGEPLTNGLVLFSNEQMGVGVSAELSSSGTYQVESLRTGEYQVAIQPPTGPSPMEEAEGAKRETLNLDIPDKYLDLQTSGLTASVNEGENTANFEF